MQTLKTDTRKRILTVSRKLFLEKGFRGATTRDIASASGITLSNLYHYYPSKDVLFCSLLKPATNALEALYQNYKDKGLVVIGFPCDQFGHQEPGTNEEIEEFCRLNHGVTFPLMAKSDVNGENANAIFKWLYSEKPFAGFGEGDTAKFMDQMLSRQDPDYASNPDIKWNFTKFIIDRKGRVVERFEPVVAPEEMTAFIEKEL